MIPILYDRTEASFTSNGLGRLSSCIRCIVTEERNEVYECEFDYPVTGVLFSEIEEGRIIACTHDEQGDIQPFDIYGRSEPINGVVTFYAHHISYRQNEITVKPFTAGSATEAIAKIKSQSINTNPFTYWTNKSVTASFASEAPKNARDLLMGEEGSMLDVFGTGEYEFDKFNVKLYLHRGQDTNVSIRYGKNLADFQNEYDVSEAYTAVVPYWLGEVADGEESVQTLVMLPELFISSGHSVPSGREVVVPMDLSDEFEDAPTESELRSTATSRLNSSDAWEANQTVTVDFVQLWQTEEYKDYAPLQRLKLCDTCGVFVPMYDTALRAKVIKVVYNVLLDRYDEMELGDKPTSYAAVLEKTYDSKVAGVVAGFQSIQVDIETAQAIAAADATAKANQAQANAISTASADATTKANQAEADAKAYSDNKLSDAVLAINADIADLQDQIDGNITTWFFSVDPTMSNPPVAYDPNVEGSGWDTDAKKKEHLGDVYYNTANGYAWRFTYENGVYSWSVVSDSGVTEAMRMAREAKDIADSKRRIFYAEPVPPYDVGDLWTQGANGDILRCATAKAEGASYSRSDWVLASNYIDASVSQAQANQAQATAISTASADATSKANQAQQNAISTASADATSKANQAQQNAISTAAADATTKANQAEQNAVDIASADATTKANQAQANAISTASADATTKANQAEQNAVSTASADATTKANNAKSQAISSANNYTDGQIASAKSTIESQYEQAIEDATELIRGGTGGYIVTTVNANGQPIELLITDNLDLTQAVNVWRWNQGGLAHSSNGYNGQFNDVAITADGKINASMILTGALTANLITAGTITDASGKNSWNLDTGVFTTEQGNVGGYTIDADGFYAVDNSGNWKNELRIINSTDGSPEIVLRRSNPNGASGIDITPSGITFYSGDDEESLAPYEYFRTVILNNYPALNIGRSNTAGVEFGDPSFDYPISFSLPVTIGNDSRKDFLKVVGSINVSSGAEYKLGDAPLLAGGRVNFGSIATGTYSDVTVTFDTAFYNVPHVTACLSTSGTAGNIGNVSVSVFGISKTGCTIRVFNNRGGALSPAVEWIAVGV